MDHLLSKEKREDVSKRFCLVLSVKEMLKEIIENWIIAKDQIKRRKSI